MTRHSNLDKDAIRSLVDQASRVATVSNKIAAIQKTVMATVKERFRHGKKLTGIDLAVLLNGVDGAITSDFHPLDHQTTKIPPTRVHPKGEKHENLYVGLRVREGTEKTTNPVYQLFMFRFYMTRKAVFMETRNLPLAFTYHAAERIIERTRNVDEAFRTIANGLLEWAPMLHHAADVSVEKNAGFMAHPCSNRSGLFLGDYLEGNNGRAEYVGMDGVGFERGTGKIEHSDMPIYVARTFIETDELRPDQTELADTLSMWRSAFKEKLAEATKEYIYPYTLLCESKNMALSDAVVEPLKELVGHQAFRRIVVPMNVINWRERGEAPQFSMRLATPAA
jgi:hypothetical protein